MTQVLKFENESIGGSPHTIVQFVSSPQAHKEASQALKKCQQQLRELFLNPKSTAPGGPNTTDKPTGELIHDYMCKLNSRFKQHADIVRAQSLEEKHGLVLRTTTKTITLQRDYLTIDTESSRKTAPVGSIVAAEGGQSTVEIVTHKRSLATDPKNAILWFVQIDTDAVNCAFQTQDAIERILRTRPEEEILFGPFTRNHLALFQKFPNRHHILLRPYNYLPVEFNPAAQMLAGTGDEDALILNACTVILTAHSGVFSSQVIFDGCGSCGRLHSGYNQHDVIANFTCENCVPPQRTMALSTNRATTTATTMDTEATVRETRAARKRRKQ